MKFNQIVLVTGLIAMTAFVSCKQEFLDLKPYDSVTATDALKSESDLLVASRGMYAGLRNTDIYGRTLPILGDLMADNIYISGKNSGRYTAQSNYSVTVTNAEVSNNWSSSYNVILRANNIINSTVPSSVNVDQYKGEAYAVRALTYFNLIRVFARPYAENPTGPGVPLVLTYDRDKKPARNTVAEVYTQILSDLNQAFTLMTKYSGSSVFSKYAAKGLAAKVNLYKGDYTAALANANEVITSGGFTPLTTTNYAAYWSSPIPNSASNKLETLFEVSSDNIANQGTNALAYIYSQAGYGDMLANPALNALYGGTDVRKALISSGTRGGAASLFVNKYPNTQNASDKDDTKVLRLSEIYLVAAEAAARLGGVNEVEALSKLNFIVSRRDGSLVYVSTGAQLISDIIQERRKELAFEGDRFFDLNRLQLDVVRSTNYPAAARTITYSDTRRIAPIPQAERDVNPTIVQNPGY
jgi:starch-binding outer membrane protein, SusD/RagB family